MNIKILMTLAVTAAIAGTAIFYLGAQEGPREIDPKNIVKSKVNMTGMTCGHCEVAIEKVGETAGIAKIKANSDQQKVEVEYDKTQTDIHTIMQAIEMKGFTPVSYEDEDGLHILNAEEESTAQTQMKCGSGKCGSAGKCGSK